MDYRAGISMVSYLRTSATIDPLTELSKFELTVPFLVDTQRRELTGRYNRRKLADQVFRRLLAASLL